MNGDERSMTDTDARRRIAEDLDATFFVEAAAGTGKTTALVSRMLALTVSGATTLERIVAVTFTDKAAGEMKLRLRARLESARTASTTTASERERLELALSQLELARIVTIHAFCGDLLHERPVEAGVDPLFRVLAEEEARALEQQAFESWFQQVLADPPEGVRRVLRRRPRGLNALGPRDHLKSALHSLIEHRDFPAPWRRPEIDRETAIDGLMEELEAVARLAEGATRPDDYLVQCLEELGRFVAEAHHMESVRPRDYDGLEADLRDLGFHRCWRWRGFYNTRYRKLSRDEVLARRDAVKARLDEVLAACEADLAPRLQAELSPVVERYERLKARAGRLDFLDLLIRTRDLLRDNRAVRVAMQTRFSHYFVDEFQDTDPLQAEILLLLAANDPEESDARAVTPARGKLFIVGDPKQSIYRFRRADIALYEAVKRRLTELGAELLELSTSFRSLPALQGFVNSAFAPQLRGGRQAAYVPLQPWRKQNGEQPAVVALPAPRIHADYGRVVNYVIEDSLADAVGAFIAWLVDESGWTVEEGEERVAIAPRHVCILFRRFKRFNDDVTRPYVRALEARRVPHVLVGGRSFHEREEVLALRNALVAIEWPDDELRVFATLRGPLFALGDDALLAFREGGEERRALHPLRPPDDTLSGSARDVADALAVLGALHRFRNRRPISETLSRLLASVRAHAGFAIWPTGEQALANVLRVVDVARRFERNGAHSFRAFVERLEEDAERGEAQDAPVVEEGTEGVRIMTVHKAKGLEFPVVVLADPTCRRSHERPGRHVDAGRRLWAETLAGCAPVDLTEAAEEEHARDDEEAVRLAYVAATRARDLLVVPGAGDEEIPGWLDVLNPAIYPADETRHLAQVAQGCPVFGDDTVLARPDRARLPDNGRLRPGRHRPRAGGPAVVWWDPAALTLAVEERVGLRQHRILEADERGAAERSETAHAQWQMRREGSLRAGACPSREVVTVTARAEAEVQRAGSADGDVAIEHVERAPGERPRGRDFGTLVHALLAVVPLTASEALVKRTAALRGRLLGAGEREIEAAGAAAINALRHPLLRRAAQRAEAGEVRRETPVIVREHGRLVEGVVDLAFREDGVWTVADYKTDRPEGELLRLYQQQVSLYARAIASATGEPARGVILVV